MNISDFHSQAFNFFSSVQGGVDPRTGLFMANMALATINGNDLMGPELTLKLNYSPLDQANHGLGFGVNLGLTTFDKNSNTLNLSTGERYKIIPGTAKLRYQKLDSVRFEQATDGSGNYFVTRKDGYQEHLVDQGGGWYMPTTIYSPAGYYLTLSWQYGGGIPKLWEVTDGNGTVLCRLDTLTNPDYPKLAVWPDTSESYTIEMTLENGYLSQVCRQAGTDTLRWYLEYEYIYPGQTIRGLVGINSPTGLTEHVTYDMQTGTAFPDAAGSLPPLPRVLSHRISPGQGQPDMVTEYEYSAYNYLGWGSGQVAGWESGKDFLFNTLGDYTYWSREIRTDVHPIVHVTRTYNNYHLLIKEETQQADCVCLTETEYYAQVGVTFDDQPAQFQLPRLATVTYHEGEARRQEKTETQFDEAGNPTKRIEPDGTSTEWNYYPAKGETGYCPAEPNGFVRFTKSEKHIPALSGFPAPVQSQHYTYLSLRPAQVKGSPVKGSPVKILVVIETEVKKSSDQLVSERTTAYIDQPSSPDHARVKAMTHTDYDPVQPEKTYKSQQSFSWECQGEALLQQATFVGHDGCRSTFSQSQSRFSGLKLSSTDGQGNETRYTYDKVGRILTQTDNASSKAYASTTSYAYTLEPNENGNVKIISTTVTDPKGNRTRIYHDGLGRSIKQERWDNDAELEKKWQVTWERQYDALGRESKTTIKDVLRQSSGQGTALSSHKTLQYDSWGQNCLTLFSDGHQEWTVYNPITRCAQTQLVNSNQKLGKQLTEYNVAGLPIKVTHYDSQGVEQGTTYHAYDGLGRLRKEMDELDHVTLYEYDHWGRVVQTTLPDQTIIRKSYAPYSAEALAVGISVNDISMGNQSFDSLDRLTQTTSGGRTYYFTYENTSPVPAQVTTPTGEAVSYDYIKELDNAIKKVSAAAVSQTFDYDALTGAMTSATEASSLSRTMGYYPSGLLKSESFTPNGRTSKSAAYTYSLAGAPQSYTNVFGTTQHYDYDQHGRCIRIRDDAIEVTLKYDAFSRIMEQQATDRSTQATLTTTLTYDDLNRETKREISAHGQAALVIEQTYQKNHLLNRRTTRRGSITLRDEQFTYDSRNRLTGYTCSGTALPQDPYGQAILRQTYSYDTLSNIIKSITTFSGGSNTATYTYNPVDPTQLLKVKNTHSEYPKEISLDYDEAGRMIRDEASRTLIYDSLGRLKQVSLDGKGGRYEYDALNTLVSQIMQNGPTYDLYYRADELMGEARHDGSSQTSYVKIGGNCVGQCTKQGSSSTTQLTGTNQQGSVLSASEGQKRSQDYVYTPYGHRTPQSETQSVLGFNGERLDPVSGTYHLGNGYRAYNPVLMRFNCPDSWSPFGAGGINPYAYCDGDPINRVDPTGHMSWQAGLGIGLGILGLVAAVFTAGASIAAAGGVMAALGSASIPSLVVGGLSVVADVTAIASGALEEANPEASAALGWASLATGAVGLAAALPGAVNVGRRAISSVSERIGAIKMHGLNGGAVKAGRVWAGNAEKISSIEGVNGILKNTKDKLLAVEKNLANEAIEGGRAIIKQIRGRSGLKNLLSKSGRVNKFILTEDNRFIIGSMKKNVKGWRFDPKYVSHPSIAEIGLGSGESNRVISAGYIKKSMGEIRIVNHSGHYRPDFDSLRQVQKILEDMGVNVSKVRADSFMHGLMNFL
jgi:RHS repeat-associated protein